MHQKDKHNNRGRPQPGISTLTFVILCAALLLLSSCADIAELDTAPIASTQAAATTSATQSAPASPTAELAQQNQPPTAPPPTNTPLPAASRDPQTLEQVQSAYRLIVVTQLLADSLNKAALDAQSGAHDVLDTQAALTIAGVISTGITRASSDLSFPEPMASYAGQAQSINLALSAIASAWRDGDRTPTAVITAIEPLMIDLAQITRDAELAMTGQWQIDPTTISQLRQDIIAEVTEIISNLGSPAAPTTPPTT